MKWDKDEFAPIYVKRINETYYLDGNAKHIAKIR